MPAPKKRKDETWDEYRNRLIKFYIAEGYPQKQAVAIAYNQVRKMKNKNKK